MKVNSTENVMTTAMIGVSIGSVTCQNFCHSVAPSSAAASYSDGEMVCNPASRVMAKNGTPRQIFAAMVDSRASHGSPRKLI